MRPFCVGFLLTLCKDMDFVGKCFPGRVELDYNIEIKKNKKLGCYYLFVLNRIIFMWLLLFSVEQISARTLHLAG